jgi:membrane glycosyltransferase
MTDLSWPAGLATSGGRVLGRRVLFAILTAATMAGVLWLAARALAANGLDALDAVLLILLAVTLPWTVIGFWNAAIGFLIMRFSADPTATVFPAAVLSGREPVTASAAILVCIRDEAPGRVLRNLEAMLAGIAASGPPERFHLYILSDTSDTSTAAAERIQYGALADRWRETIAVTYRRREHNVGFKAGNIRDFCERWGSRHDIAITLDADSVMPATAIMRLARVMQANPHVGIVQALVVGSPSTSAFARVFQFGMRLGMRSYTIGGAWWQADCGPYWGHNAALRLSAFTAHCELPQLPGGKHVLSHDQIEAVLMRRAGYEVRVLPEEDLGWEENPPTLLEFIRRDLRWCQGNMQYWRFLTLPGLKFISRYQLAFAILMFVGSPAWIMLLVLGTFGEAQSPRAFVDTRYGGPLLIALLAMWFAPKIATVVDVLTRPQARRMFGGGTRFLAGVLTETVFFLLLSPIMWFSHVLMFGGLLFGKTIGWGAQARHDHAVSIGQAFRRLWPHSALGLGTIAILAVYNPSAIPVALLIAGGLALAIPLAVVTSAPAVGCLLTRIGLGRLPEETDPPDILRALDLPALRRDG